MLNHRGGRLLFGVEPRGRALGQQVSDHTIEEVAQELYALTRPCFQPSIGWTLATGGRCSCQRGHRAERPVQLSRAGVSPAEWEVKEDLNLLKQLELIRSQGHGRGSYWMLKRQ